MTEHAERQIKPVVVSSLSGKCWVRLPAPFVEATRVEICFRPLPACFGLWRRQSIPVLFLPLWSKERIQVSDTEWLAWCSQSFFRVNQLAGVSCVAKLKKGRATLVKVSADMEDVAETLMAVDGLPLHVSFTSKPVICRMRDCDILETSENPKVNKNRCSSEKDGDSHSGVSSSLSSLCDWRRGAESEGENENRGSHSWESLSSSSLGDRDHYILLKDEHDLSGTNSGGESGYEAQDDTLSPATSSLSP